MRIVLFASAYAPAVGGVEELTRRLAERLLARGDVVEVWTIRHPATLAARETIDGIDVRRFALPMPRLSVAQLARVPSSAAIALARLQRAAAQLRPDVVHVQCFSANGVYATALCALRRVPLVVTLQGETVMDDADIYEHSATLRAGLRAGLRRAAAVTACSRFVLDDAERRFGLPAGRGVVVPNGVDLGGTEPEVAFGTSAGRGVVVSDGVDVRRAEPEVASGTPAGRGVVVPNGVDVRRAEPEVALELPFERFVLGLGRVVEKKGFDLLLLAFARIAADHPDVGLVIGGDGPARAELAARVERLGLVGRVVLPGTLSRGEVAWAMARASVFVLPSRVEPFGIVVLEALRAGRPVVVSSRGGAPEIVRHDVEGLVVDPLDCAELARAIARLLDDGELARRLGSAALARAEAFSWDAIAERYREIYRGVVA